MRVLITGATGFLGSALAVDLHREGQHVVALGRNAEKLARLSVQGIETFQIDFADSNVHENLMPFAPVDAVVHCAGLSSPWGRRTDFTAANVDGTRHIARSSVNLGVRRFVYISTASVYFRFADQDVVSETTKLPAPVNHYAGTKRAAEQIVLQHESLSPIILRPRGIYGAGDTALLPRLLRVAARGPLPKFRAAGATDITHVDDVVSAVKSALSAGDDCRGQIYNVSGGVAIPMPDIIEAACHSVNVQVRWRSIPFRPAVGMASIAEAFASLCPGYPEPLVTRYALGLLRFRQSLDVTKAANDLKWRPCITFAEGLRRTFKDGAMRRGVL